MELRNPARRRFLQSASAALALAALDVPRARATSARLADVDHIIVLMKENRSFDHYFGSLSGVRGFDDAGAIHLPDGRPVWQQPDAQHRDGYL
ncbi:MAG TPA: alkaline phosphatase family protein, partial [Casimicrobiaceae bacterium]